MATNPSGYLREYFAREKAALEAELGGKCVWCSALENLEFHHLRGHNLPRGKNGGRGRLDRLTEWKRAIKEDNLELLCVDCHKEVTRKLAAQAAS